MLKRAAKAPALVVCIWIVISLSGISLSSDLSSHLTTSLTVPDSQSESAEKILNDKFHEKSEGYISIIYKFGNANKTELLALKTKIASATTVIPHARVVQQQAIAGNLSTIVASNDSLTRSSEYVTVLRSELARIGLSKALVSGPPAIFHDVKPVLAHDLQKGQITAAIVSVILLVLTLGISWAVFIPLLFAISSVSLTLGILSLLSDRLLLVLYIPNIVELIGFGLAIDYSLLILQRFRQESHLDPGATIAQLVSRTMATAGRTVVLSGLTVAIALSTLIFIPVPFLRSLGVAGALVPLASILTSLTLMPALLRLLGERVIQTFKFGGFLSHASHTSVVTRISHLLTTKTKSVFVISLLAILALATPLMALHVTPSSLTALPKDLESSRALSYVTDRAGEGIITPIVVIADLGANKKNSDSEIIASRIETAQIIGKNPSVLIVAQGNNQPYIDPSGRYLRIFVFPKESIGSSATQSLVKELTSVTLPNSTLANYATFYLGGAPAQGVDLLNAISDAAPSILFASVLIIFLLLMRAFKSLFIPLKALLLDFISISASIGVLVAMMKFGIGHALFGTYQLPQLEIWVLVFLIAVLLGISMDYEVFIVSRIRESWLQGASNSESVINGFKETIGVVTSAALIFIGAVSGFIFGSFAGLQELGIGLVAAILIDATIIRFLLLPSAMILMGKLNWWAPKSKSRSL
ncbi:unannotated protein [freshwater metagenome]|uniref:Unannotated protein n=1 Tax=freshwater metagenome TaxID=449393 RepID=A0A6J6B3I0_9ZZZZ|nr:MMPL family transporter [Actinomycetota bacterium]